MRKKDLEEPKAKTYAGEAYSGVMKVAGVARARRVTKGLDPEAATGSVAEAANGGGGPGPYARPASRIGPSPFALELAGVVSKRSSHGEQQLVVESSSAQLLLSDKEQGELLTKPTILERKEMFDCYEVDYRFVRKTTAFREYVARARARAT
jgi:hypothetical protein